MSSKRKLILGGEKSDNPQPVSSESEGEQEKRLDSDSDRDSPVKSTHGNTPHSTTPRRWISRDDINTPPPKPFRMKSSVPASPATSSQRADSQNTTSSPVFARPAQTRNIQTTPEFVRKWKGKLAKHQAKAAGAHDVTSTSGLGVGDAVASTSELGVGDAVASTSGLGVGDAVASTSGLGVGDAVASTSGLGVGDAVASTSELGVGDAVASTSELGVGDAVASTSGLGVGDAVASTSGLGVGDAVASTSGLGVGDAVASTSGLGVGDAVASTSGLGVGDAVASTSGLDVSEENSSSMLEAFMNEHSSYDSGISVDQRTQDSTIGQPQRQRVMSGDAGSPFTPVTAFKRKLTLSSGGRKDKNTDGETPVLKKRMKKSESTITSGQRQSSLQEETRMSQDEVDAMMDVEPQEPRLPVSPPTAGTSTSLDDDTPVRRYVQAKRSALLAQSEDSPYLQFQKSYPTTSMVKTVQEPSTSTTMSPGTLLRCKSDMEVTLAIHKFITEPNVIADSSKLCVLPIIEQGASHPNLKSITPDTLADLLNGKYDDQVDSFHIVDCRYPYEYEGGHIKNAINIYTKGALIEKYMTDVVTSQDENKRFIIIFHCEFSSKRAPDQYTHLRAEDRTKNKYPTLDYPELYLLEGGYKQFYNVHKELCEPQHYIHMLHKDYGEQLRRYDSEKRKYERKRSVAKSARSLNFNF